MQTAIYPGSFDPVTNGHLDVIERASHLFDHVIIGIAHNEKKKPLFTVEERIELITEATSGITHSVEVARLDKLLVECAREHGACAIIRGMRAVSDFEFEFQMALMNRQLAPELETVFLMPTAKYTYLSASIVKEVARLGGDISPFVPAVTLAALADKFRSR